MLSNSAIDCQNSLALALDPAPSMILEIFDMVTAIVP